MGKNNVEREIVSENREPDLEAQSELLREFVIENAK